MSGRKESRLTNYQYTNHPSIQGPWTPWTNRNTEMAVADLVNDKKWSQMFNQQPTASQMVLEMFRKQQLGETVELEEKQAQ